MNFNLPQINQQQFTEMAARLPDQVLVQLACSPYTSVGPTPVVAATLHNLREVRPKCSTRIQLPPKQ